MVELASIYARLVGSRIRSQLQYRTSLAVDVLGAFAVGFIDFLTIVVLFEHFTTMGNFSVAEVAFLYGMTTISFAVVDTVVGHLDQLPNMIRTGRLDAFLVRPLGSLFQVLSADFAVRRIGRVAQGVVVLAFALQRLDIPWDLGRVVMVPVTIVCGAAIFGGVWIAAVCITFWILDAREASNSVTYGGQFLTQFPISIFSTWVRRMLAFVIPMAFVVYFPSLYILDKPDPLGFPYALRFMGPAVAIVTLFAGLSMWRIAVRHYRSTGS